MLIGCLLFLSQEKSISWEPDFHKALDKVASQRKLVAAVFSNPDSPFTAKFEESVLSQKFFVDSLDLVIPYRESVASDKKVVHGLSLPELPMVYFADEDGKVMGHLLGLFEPDFFADWTKQVSDVWVRHDALVFRSRGRMSDRDNARLAFSFALRLETDKAKSRLALLPIGVPVENEDFARLALAQGFTIKGDTTRAMESWAKLEASSRSARMRSVAKYGLALLYLKDRPNEAEAKFKEIVAMPEPAPLTKWSAEKQLKLLQRSS